MGLFTDKDGDLSLVKAGVAGFGVVAIGLGGVLFSPFTQIPAGSKGVVTHFGSVQSQTLNEGLHFTMPIYTSVHLISVRIRADAIQATASTANQQDVATSIAVNWRIAPDRVAQVYQQVGGEQAVLERLVVPNVQEAIKQITAKYDAANILSKRDELKTKLDEALAKRLGKYHIIVDGVNITEVNFSEVYTKAIEAKQVAEQKAQEATYRVEEAKQNAAAEIASATGKAQAQAILQKTVTNQTLELEKLEVERKAIDKWNGELPTTTGGAVPFVNVGGK